MGQSKLIKSPRSICIKNKKMKTSSIESLPHELLTEVIAKVAASSLTDVFNVKLASNFLNKAADDNYVFKKISVEIFPLDEWGISIAKEAASNSFWERCIENENPEALYKQGVIDYFGLRRNEKNGLMFLDQAAKSGHYGARYILGTILLLSKKDLKKGIQIIGDIKRSHVTLKECREKFESTRKRIFLTDQIHWQKVSICTMKSKHEMVDGFGWERDEKDIQCDACQCDEEIAFVCDLFRPVC